MKILNPKPTWSKAVFCMNCSAELEVDRDDLKYEEADIIYEETVGYICPICNGFNDVDVPSHIRNSVIRQKELEVD